MWPWKNSEAAFSPMQMQSAWEAAKQAARQRFDDYAAEYRKRAALEETQ